MSAGCHEAPGGADETSLHVEFSVGLRLFARNRFLVTLLTVTMICQCGTGAISTLNVFFVTRDLHASPHLFGFAETAMGAGFIVGALAAGRMVRWIGARALAWSGLLATGVLAAGYALFLRFSRLADEHRPAELPRLVRWRHPQLGQLIFIVAGGLIFVSGIRAFAALPSASTPSAR